MRLYADRRMSFPDPRHALSEGIVDVSDDVSVDRLLEAYSFGIFPWPTAGYPTLWFCPPERGVLDFDRAHVSRSLRKTMARTELTVTFDRAFAAVIDACAAIPRAGESGTWITPRLRDAYLAFHRAGYAHSVEVWRGDDLVGGLYGVYVAGNFSGESMFHRVTDASKIALVSLIEFLSSRGLKWMDVQMVTPLLERFGAHYVTREAYLARLDVSRAAARGIDFGG